MTDRRAARWHPIGTTIFADITRRANEHKAINLGQGFPDDDGPDFIKDACVRALREHPNQYAPPGGVPELTRAISHWEAPALGREADPASEITVTAGCTGALAAVMLGLINPGDEVIVFEPFYDSYRACVMMAGGTPRCVPLRPDPSTGRFTFDPTALAKACTMRTKAVVINTPHNPTGTVFSREQLQSIADICVERGITAISDEVYAALIFDGEHVSIASLPGMAERTIVCSSFGKTFSLTGWKIGWTVAPPCLTAAVRAANQFLIFAVATPLQRAAAAALASPESRPWIAALREQFRSNRDTLAEALSRLGFRPLPADAGYFVIADHTAVSAPRGLSGDVETCHALIEQAGVASIPPSAFYEGSGGEAYLRFAFCKPKPMLDEAIARLDRWAAR
jgi:aspartate/methionine/tyrosine aminotransferase